MVGEECFKRSWLGGRVFQLEHVEHRWTVWVLVVGMVVDMEDTAAAFGGQNVQGCAGLPPHITFANVLARLWSTSEREVSLGSCF